MDGKRNTARRWNLDLMSDLPDSKEVSHLLDSLAQTDEKSARLIAAVKALEHRAKTVKGLAFLLASGTVAEREAKSVTSPEYIAFTEEFENTIADREILAAKRKTAELKIGVWQSAGANRRAGAII